MSKKVHQDANPENSVYQALREAARKVKYDKKDEAETTSKEVADQVFEATKEHQRGREKSRRFFKRLRDGKLNDRERIALEARKARNKAVRQGVKDSRAAWYKLYGDTSDPETAS